MMIKSKKAFHIITVFIITAVLISCAKEIKLDWPPNILDSIYVPQESFNKKYIELKGTHQIEFMIKECYPATNVIREIVENMERKNWKRRQYFDLNPKSKLPHAREIPAWEDFIILKNGRRVYQWIEQFEDTEKRYIITYFLRYLLKDKKQTTDHACELLGIGIYEKQNQ